MPPVFVIYMKQVLQDKLGILEEIKKFKFKKSNRILVPPHPKRPTSAVYIASELQAPVGGTATSLCLVPAVSHCFKNI